MNDLRLSANTGHCLSALGIVAKEQVPAGCCQWQNTANLRITYFYYIPLLFFWTEPLCASLWGFRRQLLIPKTPRSLNLNKTVKSTAVRPAPCTVNRASCAFIRNLIETHDLTPDARCLMPYFPSNQSNRQRIF